MRLTKPNFNQAAENNKGFIVQELKGIIQPGQRVLEVASGTGQHAVHFAAELPDVHWQTSDRDINLYGLAKFLSAISLPNLPHPIELDINCWPQLKERFDIVYSANCLHVVDWSTAENYVRGAASCLASNGAMILYGPFKYKGSFTTKSNAQFDEFLRNTYPGGGIRDFEALDELAEMVGLKFVSDTQMPANNQLLMWRRT